MIGQQRYGTICGYGRLTDGEKALGKKRWKDGDGKDDEERRVRGNLRRSVSVAHGTICRVCACGMVYQTLRIELSAVGSSTVSRNSPLKPGLQESPFHRLFNLPEENSAVLYIFCGTETLENIGSVQNRGHRLSELLLPVPKPSLQLHRPT